jgi:hypothetical protein
MKNIHTLKPVESQFLMTKPEDRAASFMEVGTLAARVMTIIINNMTMLQRGRVSG